MSEFQNHMLIMRNSSGGMIWQAYEVHDQVEVEKLTASARKNGFMVEREPVGYTTETTPGWRESQEWQNYKNKKL